MKRRNDVRHEFVELIPNNREEGVVYVSIKYATAVHNCCCGCGNKVVTPLSPTDWRLTFDGETISLHPSIGNWSFECQSHYWIINDKVKWAPKWTKKEIQSGKKKEEFDKKEYYKGKNRQSFIDLFMRK
ncbi:MAG TPA: DUF6527 family protein [Bacteroidota bacterium]|nr:DUF6527 family protein [Bacteroidota bacterium]